MSDETIEQEIQAKGLTHPRVTPERIQEVIVGEEFHKLTPVLTICVLTLANGFTVTGESACASPENYNEEIGNKIAKENAVAKIWPLEGYLLKQQIGKDPKARLGLAPYQCLVLDEKEALDEKIERLKLFLDSENVGPSEAERPLLEEQLSAMLRYSAALAARISAW